MLMRLQAKVTMLYFSRSVLGHPQRQRASKESCLRGQIQSIGATTVKLNKIAQCIALMGVSGLAMAQTDSAVKLERVEITGSSIKRIAAEGAGAAHAAPGAGAPGPGSG